MWDHIRKEEAKGSVESRKQGEDESEKRCISTTNCPN